MNIKILSDVHLEFYNNYKFTKLCKKMLISLNEYKKNEILILAGDIGKVNTDIEYNKYKEFIINIKNYFNKILLSAGNHEYYDSSIDKTNYKLKLLENEIENLYFLNNQSLVLNNKLFLGTTLWGDNKNLINFNSINDFHKIFDFKNNPNNYIDLNNKCKIWLENNCINNYKDIIIITHHQPSYKVIDKKYYRFNHLNSYYACDLDNLINKYTNIPLGRRYYFIYGHTHTPNLSYDKNITYICNPYGYIGENTDIYERLFFEITI